LRANLRASLDVTKLARRAGMSVRSLHRHCLLELDTTPAKLVEKVRIEQARTLLSTTNLGTKTIAARCGFGTPARMALVFERALGKLSPEDRRVLGGILLPVGRYPLVLNARLDSAIAEALDPAHPRRIFRALGRRSAELNFAQYHGGLVAPHDPHVVMSRIGAMRRLYYADGEFASEKTGPTSVRILVHGMATVTTPDCESTAGFYEVAIARSGGRDPDVAHRCRLDGSADCLF